MSEKSGTSNYNACILVSEGATQFAFIIDKDLREEEEEEDDKNGEEKEDGEEQAVCSSVQFFPPSDKKTWDYIMKSVVDVILAHLVHDLVILWCMFSRNWH